MPNLKKIARKIVAHVSKRSEPLPTRAQLLGREPAAAGRRRSTSSTSRSNEKSAKVTRVTSQPKIVLRNNNPVANSVASSMSSLVESTLEEKMPDHAAEDFSDNQEQPSLSNKIPASSLPLQTTLTGELSDREQESLKRALGYASEGRIVKIFEECPLTNQDHILQVALACAQRDTWRAIACFSKFGLTNPTYKFQFVQACAEIDHSLVASKFEKFGLTNQDHILQIARVCVSKCHSPVNFPEFGLTDQDHILQVALAYAARNRRSRVRDFNHFGLTNQDHILQGALVWAQNNGVHCSVFDHFGLINQDHILQVALVCFRRNKLNAEQIVQDFGLTNQDHILQVALVWADQKDRTQPSDFKKLGLTNPDHILQVIRVWAKHKRENLFHIKDFGLTDPEHIFQAALACSALAGPRSSDWNMARDSINFDLENEEKRLQIALISAKKCSETIMDAFNLFHLKNEDNRLQVALACIRQDSNEALRQFNHFCLNDPRSKMAFLLACKEQSDFKPDSFDYAALWKTLQQEMPVQNASLSALANILGAPEADKSTGFRKFIETHVAKDAQQALLNILASIDKKTDPDVRMLLFKWLRNVLGRLELANPDPADLQALLPVVQNIFNHHDREMRFFLTDFLFSLSGPQKEIWKNARENVPKESVPKNARSSAAPWHPLANTAKLPVAPQNQLITLLMSSLMNPAQVEGQEAWNALGQALHAQRLVLKNQNNPLMRRLINGCMALIQTDDLSASQKQAIFQRCWELHRHSSNPSDQLGGLAQELSNLRSVLAISGVQALLRFIGDPPMTSKTLIAESIQQALQSDQPIDGQHCLQTFETWRDPTAWLTYAGRIQAIPLAMAALREFVTALMQGEPDFLKQRYQGDALFNKLPSAVQAQWRDRALFARSFSTPSNPSTASTAAPRKNLSERYFQILKDNVLTHEHLGTVEEVRRRFPLLQAYLTDKSRGAQPLASPIPSTIEDLFQRALIAFIEQPSQTLLTPVIEQWQELGLYAELANDLKSWQMQIRTEAAPPAAQEWNLVFTDDPELLLTMGNVPGSCQRLDGDPRLNQGVSGSVWDAKMKLCAITDAHGKLIGRRILRLMCDGPESSNPQFFLLMEAQYPATLPDPLEAALAAHARACADLLGLPLIQSDKDGPEAAPLKSGALKYPAYIDSAGGIVRQEGFTLTRWQAA